MVEELNCDSECIGMGSDEVIDMIGYINESSVIIKDEIIQLVRPKVRKFLGYEGSELVGQHYSLIFDNISDFHQSDKFPLKIKRKYHEPTNVYLTTKYFTANGSGYFIINFDLFNFYNKEKNSATQIQNYLEAIMQYSPYYILIVNKDNMLHFINRVGDYYQDQEAKGQPISSLMSPEYKEIVEDTIESVRSQKVFKRIQIQGQSGGYYIMNIIPLDDDHNDIMILGEDITELTESENLLLQKELEYTKLYEKLPVGVLVVSKNGTIHEANPMAERITQYSREELIGSKSKHLSPKSELEYIERVQRRWSELNEVEYQNIHSLETKEGNLRYLDYRVIYPFPYNGENTYRLSVFMDITESIEEHKKKQQMMEKLHQSEKYRSISLLTGGIAHDFNNYLMAILGNITLIKSKPGTNQQFLDYIRNIESITKDAAELSRQILSYTAEEQRELECLSINQLVKDNKPLISVAIPSSINVEYQFSDARLLVFADPILLRRFLLNILTNAVEAIGDNSGSISIETTVLSKHEIDTPTLDFRRTIEDKYVVLKVSDTGPGIPRDKLGSIFDSFYTTKQTGTGLGLAVVRGIVENHHGMLDIITSTEGTVFILYLPLIPDNIDTMN